MKKEKTIKRPLPYDSFSQRYYKSYKGKTWTGNKGTKNTAKEEENAFKSFLLWKVDRDNELPAPAKRGIETRQKMILWLQANETDTEQRNQAIKRLSKEIELVKTAVSLGNDLEDWHENPLYAMSDFLAGVWTDRLTTQEKELKNVDTFGAEFPKWVQIKKGRAAPNSEGWKQLNYHWNQLKHLLENLTLDKFRLSHWEAIYNHVNKLDCSQKHKSNLLATIRQFLIYLEQIEKIVVPRGVFAKAYTVKVPHQLKHVFSKDQVKRLLDNSDEKMCLYILLGLNCAFTQKDIYDLKVSEIDFDEGTITRKRSKHTFKSSEKIPFVVRTLWPETKDLLFKFSSKKGLALTSEKKTHNLDRIGPNFAKLCESLGITEGTFKTFRDTGATTLGNSPHMGWISLYLGNAAEGITERHYNQAVILPKEITDYLRSYFLG